MVTRPKKPDKPKVADVIKIQPTDATATSKGVGKVTGPGVAFRVDEQGRPLDRGTPAGTPSAVNQVLPQIDTGILNKLDVLPKSDTQVPPQPQNAVIGQINGVTSDSTVQQQPNLLQQAFAPAIENIGNIRKQLKGEQTVAQDQPARPLPFNIPREVAAGIATPLTLAMQGVGLTKQALNTPAEAAHFAKKIVPQVTNKVKPGVLAKGGKVANNIKTKGLFSNIITSVYGQLGVGLAALAVVQKIADDPRNTRAWDSLLDTLEDDVSKTEDLVEQESIPEIKEAYEQELDMLLQIQQDITDPTAIQNILLEIPYIDDVTAAHIRSRTKRSRALAESRRKDINRRRNNIIEQRASALGTMPADVREAIIDYAAARSKDVSTVKTLLEVQ